MRETVANLLGDRFAVKTPDNSLTREPKRIHAVKTVFEKIQKRQTFRVPPRIIFFKGDFALSAMARTLGGCSAAAAVLWATCSMAAPNAATFTAQLTAAAIGQAPGGQSTDKNEALQWMGEARIAMQRRDFARARFFIRKAAQSGVNFEGSNESPARLQAELEQLERGSATSTLMKPPASSGDFNAGNNAYGAFPAQTGAPNQAAAANPYEARRVEGQRLTAQAQAAMDRGDYQTASRFVQQAMQLGVPDSAYRQGDTRPEFLKLQLDRAMSRTNQIQQADFQGGQPQPGQFDRGVYRPGTDNSRVAQVNAQDELSQFPTEAGPNAQRLFDMGLKAAQSGDKAQARTYFERAWKIREQLDPFAQQMLQERLSATEIAGPQNGAPEAIPAGDTLQNFQNERDVESQRLMREILNETAKAESNLEKDPRGALDRLSTLRTRVAAADIEPATRKHLLTNVDRTILRINTYIRRNISEIQNDERNQQVLDEVDRDRRTDIESQNRLAGLVEEFNRLMDEQRFAEAEILAKQAQELRPNDPVVENLKWKSRFARQVISRQHMRDAGQEGFLRTMDDVERGAVVNVSDDQPIAWGDINRWEDISNRRVRENRRTRFSPEELRIQEALKLKVDVSFTERPLSEVMAILGAAAGINIYLDPDGLGAESVTSATPVSINLGEAVSLQSALNLILRPLRLGYVVQDEVLRVTSESVRENNTYPEVYNVADLVTPIPNFLPSYNMGLAAAIKSAHDALGYGGGTGGGPLVMANNEAPSTTDASVLAQMGGGGSASSSLLGPQASGRHPGSGGPGGLGGAAAADFDSLISLITRTVDPESWEELGGAGTIEGFPANLTLVVRQTQDVHREIADLLEQLRRLQDLQVTIEVRFIILQDNFFEQIGVDFDFAVQDNTGLVAADIPGRVEADSGPSNVFGLAPSTTGGLEGGAAPTNDLDLNFTQGSFLTAVPQFAAAGGVGSAANFGFAILSDIEVFFLLTAGQGNTRSNILQAPKVTLFNGQSAFIADQTFRPFVTSVIPVVGDFAAAHQPVVVVLTEGTALSVQAVVSADRRFVRLTLVPFFSSIGDVQTFTFNQKTSSETGTIIRDPITGAVVATSGGSASSEGTTIQLPTFATTTVTTTVSVPDGGTVLLGGVKRLSEGRNEFGVPLLSKIPYVNRLFKNVAIDRNTQSLMLMVTPRIIIQEEEELAAVGDVLGG